ncbi:MAG: hypothetical protein UX06_C0012G0008 [Candidatus Giovannonibacteria bacterium GW2011_GWA2_45_21]|uniref:Uncharacterized protein n=1 Tax=Candidatus Giovannonibacteria bacterium GW2011_GWA2_45_21 TaxID=1618649 RepID=A0A0G1PGY3_9BACT|nr:MAG: hypothetical protein UX06_C0012G0008 [Candidatus Giovannonibacteria bacterium GW2011_GWA2_45_21]
MTRKKLLEKKGKEIQKTLASWAKRNGILYAGEEIVFSIRFWRVETVRENKKPHTGRTALPMRSGDWKRLLALAVPARVRDLIKLFRRTNKEGLTEEEMTSRTNMIWDLTRLETPNTYFRKFKLPYRILRTERGAGPTKFKFFIMSN